MSEKAYSAQDKELNKVLLDTAIEAPFDIDFPCELDFVSEVRSFYSYQLYSPEVEHVCGAIFRFRSAHYSWHLIKEHHEQGWRDIQAAALASLGSSVSTGHRIKGLNPLVIEFHFGNFLLMCRACLDCLALWLNQVYQLGIDQPLNLDLRKREFRKPLRQNDENLDSRLAEFDAWFERLTSYRDIVSHRGLIYPLYAREPRPGVYLHVIEDPTKRLHADREWLVKQKRAGKWPTESIDIVCELYLDNLTSVMKACFEAAHPALGRRLLRSAGIAP